MSTTSICLLKYPEGVAKYIELENSHGSAPVVWDIMAQTYLNLPPFHYSFHTDKLWPLWKRLDIPKSHRAVLGMTYDNTIIRKEEFARAADDIQNFLNDFPVNKDVENHWPRIMRVLRKAKDCDAIGFHWTSVGECPFVGDWNDELEEDEPPNWTKFWSLYHTFDKINENLD